jgi:hypothetical protein
MIVLNAEDLKKLVAAREVCERIHAANLNPLSDERIMSQTVVFAITSVLKISVLQP